MSSSFFSFIGIVVILVVEQVKSTIPYVWSLVVSFLRTELVIPVLVPLLPRLWADIARAL